MQIYIADDDKVSLTLITKLVASRGQDIVSAESGEALLEKIYAQHQEGDSALLILDWEMPGLVGPDLCRKIRERYTQNPPYIILLTGRDKPSDLAEGLSSGANDYITKPFSAEELLARLDVGIRTLNLQVELSRVSDELVDAEKMASLGRLAAGAAHEINNPLGFVSANTAHLSDLCRKLLAFAQQVELAQKPDPAIKSALKTLELEYVAEDLPDIESETRSGLTRIRDIVDALGRFSYQAPLVLEPCQIHEFIPTEFRANRKIERDNLEALPPVKADTNHLSRLFNVLLDNAVQATQAGGEVIVSGKRLGENLAVVIEDTGVGMDADVRRRAVEPFFTTRDVGQGLGLGLSTAFTILKQLDGRLRIHSKLGKGTLVTVELPLWTEPLETDAV